MLDVEQDKTPIEVSFIIPHKGREDLLQQTIESLLAQDFPEEQLEIIVVTQNQGMNLTSLPSHVNISLIVRDPSDTISTLRNEGVAHSRGVYIAFIDADVALAENWVTAMLDELESVKTRVLCSAIQKCTANAAVLEKIRTSLSNAVVDSAVRFLPGRNLLIRRSTFNQVGGFPEHLVTCEDYYFTDKVHEHGDLYYSSKSSYIHLGEDKVYREMFSKEIWRGQSNLQSIKGRKIPFSEIPSFLVPVWILIFFLMFIVFLLGGFFVLSGLALWLMLLPIMIYSLRLYRIAKGEVSFFSVLKFYALYFPARIIGTVSGLFKTIRV